ncbi:DUF3817 domain-containing protein [Mycobacterium sp. MYCO198283]|uniref:DUF3817 domain-containing protein n=1 Tax=Mycobacterium sp. MYCO198283 TaxID=2883505 RepID=UPI001EF04C22
MEPDPPETEIAERTPSAVDVAKVRRALVPYRILAWTTGALLIALCYEMVVKYLLRVEDVPTWLTMIPFVHGWVYFAYLLATANLAVNARWPIGKTLGTLISGTIPLAGVIVEHFRTREVKARFGI